MALQFLSRIFGSKNERELKRMRRIVQKINEFEPDLEKLSQDELFRQREVFRGRLDKGESLEDILPEAFATVREAAKRALGLSL